MPPRFIVTFAFLVLLVVASACTPAPTPRPPTLDVQAVSTHAAATIFAGQTASAPTATRTPTKAPPTPVPMPTRLPPTPTQTLTPTLTPVPGPTTIPRLEVWLTKEPRPDNPIKTLKAGQAQAVYIWVRAPAGTKATFEMWATLARGERYQLAPLEVLETRPTGNPESYGAWSGDWTTMKGTHTLETLIGSLSVGSTTIAVE